MKWSTTPLETYKIIYFSLVGRPRDFERKALDTRESQLSFVQHNLWKRQVEKFLSHFLERKTSYQNVFTFLLFLFMKLT
ncbi:Uncharacterized protein TCM_033332 [Theobroma cacao]|uniref:Uncharacterized protein n=1 Tax=Theobroma cacao TaxID=3641 RepID=A0A061FHZ2_THECC|nr:Uncharacterized protein TCM_033332 [Theobroma cacao]